MPANFVKGFFVRVPAWHEQGTVIPEYTSREESMRLAGHDFEIGERPVWDEAGVIENKKSLYRTDTGARLEVVNKSYGVVQNSTAWDVVDAIIGADEAIKYDTAGILNGGANLWVMALLDEPFKVAGDQSETFPYLSCSWSHDGSGALNAKAHMTRIVCANTEQMAQSEAMKAGRLFSFRHTVNVMARIEEAKKTILGLREWTEDFKDLANDLARLTVSDEGVKVFVEQLRPRSTELVSDRVRANEDNDRALITSYLNGPTCEGIRNTAYGLVQAGIEFLDHGRKYRNTETLLNRTVLKGEPLKDKLVTLARAASEQFPVRVA